MKLDLVIAAAPSEEEPWSSDFIQGHFTPDDWPMDSDALPEYLADFFKDDRTGEPKWKQEPLYIPDRDTHEWQRTHPLEQRGGLVCLNSAARFDKWNRAAVR